MKQCVYGLIGTIILILLLCSGIFTDIIKFFTWLVCLDYLSPDVSLAGAIIIIVLIFFISYALVVFIFNLIGLFNSRIIKLTYFIISTLLSFALSYIVMCIERYWISILIVISILLVFICVIWVAFVTKERKNNHE